MASLFDALRTARSGLTTFGTAISIVSNNIANVLTPGFKPSRPEFTSVVHNNAGQGVALNSTVRLIDQGLIEPTDRALDLGISGNGLFAVQGPNGIAYTRAGNFSINSTGDLVTERGFAVLGYSETGQGGLEPLSLRGDSSVSPTTTTTLSGNFDATIPVTAPPSAGAIAAGAPPPATEPLSFTDLANSSQFSAVVEVTDSLGGSREISLFFTKTAPHEVTVQAFAQSQDVDPSGTSTGAPRLLGSATMQFGTDGLRSNIPAPPTQDFTGIAAPFQGGADAAQQLNISLSQFTQFAQPSAITANNSDGRGAGDATGVSVQNDGKVVISFSNGERRDIGTVAVATFVNPAGLVSRGDNLLDETQDSGPALYNMPGSGNAGSIESGVLEGSAVDLVGEFVQLFSYSQAFRANAKVFSLTQDLAAEIDEIV
jgi:flagellar hook protein FlgE